LKFRHLTRGGIYLRVADSDWEERRPAVIVSNDGANATAARLGRGVITVVPVTSSIERVYSFQVLLPAPDTGLDRDSKAQAEQVRSLSVERIFGNVGTVPPTLMAHIDETLRLHLGL
jgi:mRNA interferase MazF